MSVEGIDRQDPAGRLPNPPGAMSDEGQVVRSEATAGALFTIVGIGIVLSTITGEALYPRRYTTYANSISDLSGTEPPHSVMLQPTRTLFIVTMYESPGVVGFGSTVR